MTPEIGRQLPNETAQHWRVSLHKTRNRQCAVCTSQILPRPFAGRRRTR